MKILCVGDIHAKPWVVHAVELIVKDYDRVIFLGDYVDDWGADSALSVAALEAVSVLMRRHDNVVVLRGNHDFSEYYGYAQNRKFLCSGFNYPTHVDCHLLYQNNWDEMLTVYIAHGNEDPQTDWYISHAGLTSGWYKKWSEWFNGLKPEQKANTSLLNTEEMLDAVGSARGGVSSAPSPIWADAQELKASPAPYLNQIVGHTPVKTVECHEFRNGDGSRNRLFFCDTFSTYRDGREYGDGSCLSLDTEAGTWKKVYPMEIAERKHKGDLL